MRYVGVCKRPSPHLGYPYPIQALYIPRGYLPVPYPSAPVDVDLLVPSPMCVAHFSVTVELFVTFDIFSQIWLHSALPRKFHLLGF